MNVRRASIADQTVIVEFNRLMAWETERKRLDDALLNPGVAAALADEAKGFYLLAESDDEILGQLMITAEWSDWRNGHFWWIQSVYVRESARRQGVFRELFREVERLAREASNVVGLRLYVEQENESAQETYRRLGLKETAYRFFERGF